METSRAEIGSSATMKSGSTASGRALTYHSRIRRPTRRFRLSKYPALPHQRLSRLDLKSQRVIGHRPESGPSDRVRRLAVSVFVQSLRASFRIDFVRKMAERAMIRSQLYEWRKLASADFFGAFTSRSERTTGRQMRKVWRQTRNLIKPPLLCRGIGDRTQQ